jgi:hypothetical protein
MEDKGEVCFEEKVDRLRREGKSTAEISQIMGVDRSWVESLVSMLSAGEGPSAAQSAPERS